MLRRAWKPAVGGAVLVGASSYLYYKSKPAKIPETTTFDLPVRVRGPDGKAAVQTRTFPLMSVQQVDDTLTKSAVNTTSKRPNGIVWNQSSTVVAANNPCEDSNAMFIVERAATEKSPAGDLLFFAVFDGHSGTHTSRLLSGALPHSVSNALASRPEDSPILYATTGYKGTTIPTTRSSYTFDLDPDHVKTTIERTFINLDHQIVNAPLNLLLQALPDGKLQKGKPIPDLSAHPKALETMQPALSGACALLAVVDTASENLYVACTGDSRAVAGIYEESEDGKGSWRVEVLSEDQTGRNPKEQKRIQSEHPPDEANAVIRGGRILGGLEPSRAFGDARYKWPREVQEALQKAFMEGDKKSMRPPPPDLKTPPYVTARPEITQFKLPLPKPDSPPKSKGLSFIVLATDGLWDELSSEQVVGLVGGYLLGLKGSVPKSTLPKLVPTTSGTQAVEGKEARSKSDEGAWAFVDKTVSAHLIRNALGGANEQRVRRLLSIPTGLARRYRDDTTVHVVWWEDERLHDDEAAAIRNQRPQQPEKAKL